MFQKEQRKTDIKSSPILILISLLIEEEEENVLTLVTLIYSLRNTRIYVFVCDSQKLRRNKVYSSRTKNAFEDGLNRRLP